MNEVNNLIDKPYLGREVPAVVQHVLQAPLYHIGEVLSQNLRRLCPVDRRKSLTGLRDLRKLAGHGIVDDLFIEARVKHGASLLPERFYCYNFSFTHTIFDMLFELFEP